MGQRVDQHPAEQAAGAKPPPSGRSRRSPSWRVLKEPRFRAYFIGLTISNLGTWLQTTAQLLLVYRLTRSPLDIAIVTSAQFAGFLTIGPWAGSIAARAGTRRVLVGTQLVSATVSLVLAGLQVSGLLGVPGLAAGALITGFAATIALPVQTTVVSALVPPRDLKAALGMNSVSYNAGRAVAPLLSVAIMTTIGAGWAFTLNALSFLVFARAVMALPRIGAIASAAPVRPRAVAGIVLQKPRLLLLLAMVAAITFADDPVLVLGPSVAHAMAAPSFWPAYFLSALGIGTVLGAVLPRRAFPSALKPSGHTRRAAIALAVLAVSVLIFAAGFAPWISFTAAAIAGLAGLVAGSTAQALLARIVPEANLLQVMALWGVAWAGTKPIASLLDGALASQHGVGTAALVLVAPALLIGCGELALTPGLRRWVKSRIAPGAPDGGQLLPSRTPYIRNPPVK